MPKKRKNPRSPLHSDKDRVSSTGMFRFALEFYAAGMILDDAWENEPEYLFTSPVSAYFLLARSIELAVKSYLLQKGASPKELFSFGHDLKNGLRKQRNRGLCSLVDINQDECRTIVLLNQLYANKEYEYFVRGPKTYPIFGNLHPIVEKLLIAVSSKVPHAMSMIERSKHGEYLKSSLAYVQAKEHQVGLKGKP